MDQLKKILSLTGTPSSTLVQKMQSKDVEKYNQAFKLCLLVACFELCVIWWFGVCRPSHTSAHSQSRGKKPSKMSFQLWILMVCILNHLEKWFNTNYLPMPYFKLWCNWLHLYYEMSPPGGWPGVKGILHPKKLCYHLLSL